jgi:hypothetical protein
MKDPALPVEFQKAGARIMAQRKQYGSARPGALAWVLQFAQEKLRDLSAGGSADRLEEVKRFSLDAGIGEALAQGDARDSLLLMDATVETELPASCIPLSVLLRLQEEAHAILTNYMSNQPGLTVHLPVSYELTGRRVRLHLHDQRHGFLLHLFHLLADLGPRVKRCEYGPCGKLFLAGRKDKQFCSALCQAMQWKVVNQTRTAPKGKTKPKGGTRHGTKG